MGTIEINFSEVKKHNYCKATVPGLAVPWPGRGIWKRGYSLVVCAPFVSQDVYPCQES